MELQPIRGHLVVDEHAAQVVAPPYDSLSVDQRRELIARQPDNYLTVLPTDRGDPDDTHSQASHAAKRAAVDRLLRTGRFAPLPGPVLLIQELDTPHGRVRAVVGDLPARHYRDGGIRPHESVRPEGVAALAAHLREVGIASSPVSVIHRPDVEVARLTAAATHAPAQLDARLTDGTRLRVWIITDPDTQQQLARALAAAGPLTVADGHHRAAAVDAALGGDGPVLTAMSPADHLDVLAFHRRIEGLGDVGIDAVREVLGPRLHALDGSEPRPEPGVVHLFVAGGWHAYRLAGPGGGEATPDGGRRDPAAAPDGTGSDLAAVLDAARAETEVIGRLRGLAADADAVTVVPVPATAGTAALERPGAIGLALHPPDIEQLMAVAEAGRVMPYKSTYLVPKLRSGVVVVPRTDTAPDAARVPGPG